MGYLLLIVEPTTQRPTRTEAEGHAVYQRMVDFGNSLRQRGVLQAVESLKSQDDAARVAVRHGKTQVLDGPFAEAKEVIAGFAILDVRSRDEAIELAMKFAAVTGTPRIDVRQIVEFSDLP